MCGLFRFFVILPLAGYAGGANAQDRVPTEAGRTGSTKVQTQMDCSCRALGRDYLVGATICFETAAGLASFKCVMDQNVTSWRQQSMPCPTT